MKFGELLARLRKEKGILQKEVATYLNVTVATISNYEKGVHSPDYETLVKLADFFDVSTDYLLQRTNYRASINTLNKKLIVNYTASDLLNAIMQLDQRNMEALFDYYELLSLRNSMKNVKLKSTGKRWGSGTLCCYADNSVDIITFFSNPTYMLHSRIKQGVSQCLNSLILPILICYS